MKTDRLLAMVTILIGRRHITARELAQKFEVSIRTIYRDMDTLSAAGIPIFTERGPKGGISLEAGYTVDRAMFSQNEQNSIITALQTMKAAKHPGVDPLIEKLGSVFKNDQNIDWLRVDFNGWAETGEDVFYLLRDAILAAKLAKIVYANAKGEVSERVVEPLQLISRGSGWYLSAWCTNKGDYRLFRLSRMRSASVEKGTFIPRPLPMEPMRDGPETIIHMRLIFSPAVEYRVMDEFSPGNITRLPDGRLEVRCAFPDNSWVSSFLLSFGDLLEVAEPDSLRDLLAKKAKNILSLYSSHI